MRAQKRFKIPRPDYSSEIVKKNDIPHPDDGDDYGDDDEPVARRSKIVSSKQSHKKAKKRQYVQYPQMQQYAYNNQYASNFLNSGNMFGAQQAMLQYQQPQQLQQAVPNVAQQAASVTSHVQNLDGAITRPILTGVLSLPRKSSL